MLVDVGFLMDETLERARSFFAEPTPENGNASLDPRRIEAMFGHEVVSQGVYLVGSPNAANHLREVVDLERRYRGEWCGHRLYGVADSVDQILQHATPETLGQACIVLAVPVREIPEKSGPYIGTRENPHDGVDPGHFYCWSLVPIDPVKLEAALEKRAAAAPAP